MKVKLEDLKPEDQEKYRELYLWAEVARSSVLSPQDTYEAFSQELQFMSRLPERYDLPEDGDWEIDPILGSIFEKSD